MGLASIPFLVSIWTAVVSILKSLWDAAKTRVLLIGLFFAKLVSWVIDLIRKWGVYKFVLRTALVLLVLTGVRAVIQLIPQLRPLVVAWGDLYDMMPGLAWLIWDDSGPIRLVVFFRGMTTTLSAWITLAIAKFTIRKLRFDIQVALGMKLKDG